MTDFKKLLVWQKAHALAVHAYGIANGMRRSRDSALRSQLVRSAMSVPANIVEGRRQRSEKEFARFLNVALNSGVELEYHLILARDLQALPDADADALVREVIEVRKMIHGLLKKLDCAPPPHNPGRRAPS